MDNVIGRILRKTKKKDFTFGGERELRARHSSRPNHFSVLCVSSLSSPAVRMDSRATVFGGLLETRLLHTGLHAAET